MGNGHAPTSTRVIGACAVLFFASLVLSSYSSKHPETAQYGSQIVSSIVAPVEAVFGSVERALFSAWDKYVNLVNVKRENQLLKKRINALEAQNSRLLEFKHENERLRAIVGMKESFSLKGVVANVIGYDPSKWVRSVTVDKGTLSGIQRGMPVVDGKGVVGHVTAVSRNSSRVLLVIDHASAIDAIVQRNRARGVVEGVGRGKAKMSYVLSSEDIKIGDRIITSGAGGMYPKGLLIGVVVDVARDSRRLFQKIIVAPAVNFSKLENVM
ncbi:MAG: rod shape-determining protein MreC, partial [Candidatus Dadabacteria bacterium]